MKDQAQEEAKRIAKDWNYYLQKTHGARSPILDDDDVLTMIGLIMVPPGIISKMH